MADQSEHLAGVLAKADGPCVDPTCETGTFLKDEQIVKHKDGWMHVRHASGWDDEGGRTRKPPRKRAAKKSPAGGAPATVEAVEVSNPPAGDAPTRDGFVTVSDFLPPEAIANLRAANPELDAHMATFETPGDITLTRPMSADEADEWWEQTTPGLVYGMPNAVYHRDPWIDGSVSNSDAKLLLDAPALYRYAKDNPRTSVSKAMNLGSAAHTRVLGEGDELVKVDSAEYRTNDAKKARDDALAAGKIPLLGVSKPGQVCEWDTVEEMARVLEQDELAPLLFTRGRAEVSAFWVDPETGVPRRCRFDWLPDKVDGQTLILPDFKSTADASPGHFSKAAVDFGYALQDWTYSSALAALGIDPDARFVFVNQETKPPYLVSVVQLDDDAREWGHQRTLRALRRYLWCVHHNEWPGYGGEVHRVSLRPWVFDQEAYETTQDRERYQYR